MDLMIADDHSAGHVRAALAEFAIESSILKVASSEALDFILARTSRLTAATGWSATTPPSDTTATHA